HHLDTHLQDTLDIRQSLAVRTQLIDMLLRHIFKVFDLVGKPVALFAIGGYGRGELLPQSDIDILMLHHHPCDATLDALQTMSASLWDTGLTPALFIRSSDDHTCALEHTVATSLLENRFLIGDDTLAHIPKHWVKMHWTVSKFFDAKMQEAKERYLAHQSTEYNLEPNIKNAPGGLRDIHILRWLAISHFDHVEADDTLKALVEAGVLVADEAHALMEAQHFLWSVRHHLHTLTGKEEDRLLFNHQKTIGARMGFGAPDDQSNATPEALMKQYYHHAMTVASLSEMLCALFAERYLETKADKYAQALDDDFMVVNKRTPDNCPHIAAVNHTLFYSKPDSLLRLFLMMGKHSIKRIAPTTLRQLRLASVQIDETYRQNPAHTALFLANLCEPNYLFHRLRLMKRHGVLGRYLPDFGKIMGLMQYDLFHRYTVDAHTLFLVRLLHRFETTTHPEFWLVSRLYRTLPKRHLLVIAALFHDIAKGQGGDHSNKGAVLARQFCQAHHLEEEDGDLVVWLVEEHLTMSLTAQKKDIHDPEVLSEFAQFVGNKERLDFLYILTVADMNATNSQLWNSWRATLLRQLYLGTERLLALDSSNATSMFIAARKERALARLQPALNDGTLSYDAIHHLWQSLGASYIAKETGNTLAWHAHTILTHTGQFPLIALRAHPDTTLAATQLLVYTPNQDGLFASVVSALDALGFSVLNANILTSHDDMALDTFVILKAHDPHTPNTHSAHQTLEHTLIQALTHRQVFSAKPTHFGQKLKHARLQHFDVATHIDIQPSADHRHSLFITTKDRASLLADIGQVLAALGVDVHSAKITTLGEHVEDTFVISGKTQALTDAQLITLKESLINAIDTH
ncbi:MAG: [protein-PII] uridylyltransferase, partial [Moraxella sp.]|nr:[protein-PII] uridylyltransferase [Moraxella sp.]